MDVSPRVLFVDAVFRAESAFKAEQRLLECFDRQVSSIEGADCPSDPCIDYGVRGRGLAPALLRCELRSLRTVLGNCCRSGAAD